MNICALVSIFLLAYPCFGRQLDSLEPVERMLSQSAPFVVSDPGQYITENSVVLALQDGGYFVAWDGITVLLENYNDANADFNIYGKIYNSDGTIRKPQFIINSIRTNKQYIPVLAQLADGRILVVWNSNFDIQSMSYTGRVYTYRCTLNADGTKDLDDMQISNTSLPFTVLRDGRIAGRIVSYNLDAVVLSDSTLTTFNAIDTGNPSMGSGAPGIVSALGIVATNSGGFMVFLEIKGYNGSQETRSIDCELYNSAGQLVTRFNVSLPSTYTYPFGASAAALPNGDIVVVWTAKQLVAFATVKNCINGVILAQDGTVVKPEFMVDFSSLYLLPLVLSQNGEFLVTWYNGNDPTVVSGRRYNADCTPKDNTTTLFQSGQSQINKLSSIFSASMNNGSFLTVAVDTQDRNIKALVFTPGATDEASEGSNNNTNNSGGTGSSTPNTGTNTNTNTNSNSTMKDDNPNIGLIVGISVVVILILLVVSCVGMKMIKKRRNEKQQKLAMAEEEANLNHAKQKKQQNGKPLLKPTQQKGSNKNGATIEILNHDQDVQIMVLHDTNAQKVEDIGILQPNNLRLINFIDSTDKNVPSQSNEINFAPELNSRDTRNFIMDGRLAKPAMNKSHQPLERSSSNEPLIQASEGINQAAGVQFAPRIDSSTLKTYLLDGRLAKGRMPNMAQQFPQNEHMNQPAYQDHREKEEKEEEQELSVDNLLDVEKRERGHEANNQVSNVEEEQQQLSVEDLSDAEKRERGSENEVESQVRNEEERKDKLCIVCEAVPSTMVFLDCMHLCTCQTCSGALMSSTNRCPICREVIRDVKKVFVV